MPRSATTEVRNGTKTRKLHATHNDLPQKTREKMIELLNSRLADCSDLASHARMAHWNVKGPQFIGLHKLFQEIYEGLGEQMDELAERCVQLGGTAKGTVRIAAQQSQIEEYPIDCYACEDHVRELCKRMATYAKAMRGSIEETEDAGDMVTSDMFIEFTQQVDKWIWMAEAHIQEHR